MRRALVADSISSSSDSSSRESTSAFKTESRRRAEVTRRIVCGKASLMTGMPSIFFDSDAAADGIDVTAHLQHARNVALDHGIDRPFVFKQGTVVRGLWPSIGHRVGKEKVQALECSHESRNARQLILRKRIRSPTALCALPRALRNTEQRGGFPV